MSSKSSPEAKHDTYVVALTGGIAAGKTLISDEFAKLGVPVIDTDVIAHKIVEQGQPALQKIAEVFGTKFIDSNGRLKRSDLRALIFSNSKARKQLESILHPKIRLQVSKAIKKVTAVYCVLVIPLLAKKSDYPNVNRILVIDVEPNKQISRLMVRDNCSREQANQVLAAQIDREQRLEIADDILNNSSTPDEACQKVQELHKKYTQLAISV